MDELLVKFAPDLISILTQSGLVILVIVILCVFIYFMYLQWSKNDKDKRIHENEWKDITKDFNTITTENQNINKKMIDLIEQKEELHKREIEKMNFACEQHKFRVEKHIVVAKENIESALITINDQDSETIEKLESAIIELQTALDELRNKKKE